MIYRCPLCDRYGVFWRDGCFECVHCHERFLLYGTVDRVAYVGRIGAPYDEPLPVLKDALL